MGLTNKDINGGPHIVQFTTSISATYGRSPGSHPGSRWRLPFFRNLSKVDCLLDSAASAAEASPQFFRNHRNDPMLSVHMWRRVGPVAKMRFSFVLYGKVWICKVGDSPAVEINSESNSSHSPPVTPIAIFSTR